MKALLTGKPFLWDIYKESNGAHIGKLEEFFTLFPTSNESLKELFLGWNTTPSSSAVKDFLQINPLLSLPSFKDILDFLK